MSSVPLKKSTLSSSDITPEQDAAIDALYEGNRLLIAKKGFGKAVVGLTAIQALQDDGWIDRALVVAPLKVCQLTWASEWAKWDHLRPVAMALGNEPARIRAIESGAKVVVLNLENLAWFFDRYGDDHGFDGLLIDELSKLKSAGGAAFKALRGYRGRRLRTFKWRAGMSASPVAETGVDIYAQALIIDGGRALGTNQETFRNTYFYPTDFQRRKWELQPGAGERLATALGDMIYMADDDLYEATLPELRDEIIDISMPDNAWVAYGEMCEEMFIEGLDIEAVNLAVVSGKLRQITAGAIYGAEKELHWLHKAKFDALQDIIDTAEGPLAIAYDFLFELAELKSRWPDIVVLGDDPVAAEAAWTAGDVKLLALHPKSAAHGLNLQYGGHELVVLSPPWGADPWEQLIGRFRRRGQRSPYVRRTTLVVPATIDALVLDRLMGKAVNEATLMRHIAAVAQR